MSHLPTEYLSTRTGGLYERLRGRKPAASPRPESNSERDQAALEFLSRECSIEVLGQCVARISDGDIVDYLLDQILVAASLLSSEAFTGIEGIRRDLRLLGQNAIGKMREADLRLSYDRRVERLGQHFFALGRRLHQLEQLMASCPMSGSGETLRGRYGQRVRDLAGDVRFMRQELGRWVRRFVPLGRGAGRKGAPVDAEFIAGRIDAVVDELGLRIREVGETLSTVLVEQLILFDASITRKKLFRRDLENVLDVGQLLDGLANLFDRVKAFEAERKPEQLARVKALLSGFRPDEFLSFSGVRESQQKIFAAAIEDLMRYQAIDVRREGEDPIQVFLLVTGDLIAHLRRRHRSPID